VRRVLGGPVRNSDSQQPGCPGTLGIASNSGDSRRVGRLNIDCHSPSLRHVKP
jgi:hypothetical protein